MFFWRWGRQEEQQAAKIDALKTNHFYNFTREITAKCIFVFIFLLPHFAESAVSEVAHPHSLTHTCLHVSESSLCAAAGKEPSPASTSSSAQTTITLVYVSSVHSGY